MTFGNSLIASEGAAYVSPARNEFKFEPMMEEPQVVLIEDYDEQDQRVFNS